MTSSSKTSLRNDDVSVAVIAIRSVREILLIPILYCLYCFLYYRLHVNVSLSQTRCSNSFALHHNDHIGQYIALRYFSYRSVLTSDRVICRVGIISGTERNGGTERLRLVPDFTRM